mgnify:CR=1 FL=1
MTVEDATMTTTATTATMATMTATDSDDDNTVCDDWHDRTSAVAQGNK